MSWIHTAQDGNRWRAVVNMFMNLVHNSPPPVVVNKICEHVYESCSIKGGKFLDYRRVLLASQKGVCYMEFGS
jgi:hypothetical protein